MKNEKGMHYRVFYFFERSSKTVSSTSAVEMSANSIREQLLGRLRCADDYLGIIDGRENVLQILCEPGAGRFWVELPLDAARASYGRYMSLPELEDLIRCLPQVFDRSLFPGLKYKPW